MPIIRESPHSKISPDKNSTQWPPRSPFQALLSSPSGRKKWRDERERRNERSVSPSPVKNPVARRTDSSGDDEDEDEETLQLKLQAIEAKLKLKKLQNAKKAVSDNASDKVDSVRSTTSSRTGISPRKPRPQSWAHDGDSEGGAGIEVPLSPVQDRRKDEQVQTSPARTRLGLNPCATKAQDVSLKRARDGTRLPKRHTSSAPLSYTPQDDHTSLRPVTSFSERLARGKAEAQERRAKDERIERKRAHGFQKVAFGVPEGENDGSKELYGGPRPGPTKRTESKTAGSRAREGNISRVPSPDDSIRRRGNGMFSGARTNHSPTRSANHNGSGSRHNRSDSDSSLDVQNRPPTRSKHDEDESEANPSYYDSFAEIHLTKRHVSHTTLAREMADKEIYTLPRLLKEVKAPDYDPPDCEADFVVFAILASKSQPYDQKQQHRTSDEHKPQEDAQASRNKFMVLHLCNLKWELDLFLFGTAFDQFWKLTPGTLLCILNPGIMPPKTNQNSGRFCLKLGSSEDSIMEIGIARDLGWCESRRKDGKECGAWVDKRKTGICEFHLEMAVDKEGRRGRMEVNTMWRSHEGTSKGGRGGRGGRGGKSGGREKNSNVSFRHEYGQLYSIPTGLIGGFASGAGLLDAEDKLQGAEAEEASRKRIAAAQRERDLAKRLGEIGKGVGAEYLRSRHPASTTAGSQSSDGERPSSKGGLFDKPSAASLGLLARNADDVHLSPAKDRKRHFGTGAISTAGPEAVGWGGSRKAGLLQPKESKLGSPEKGQTTLDGDRGRKPVTGIVRARSTDGRDSGSASPTKKRARFALEKGIREPGRESFGRPGSQLDGDGGHDDDELDIV